MLFTFEKCKREENSGKMWQKNVLVGLVPKSWLKIFIAEKNMFLDILEEPNTTFCIPIK